MFRICPAVGFSGDSDCAASSAAVSSSFGIIRWQLVSTNNFPQHLSPRPTHESVSLMAPLGEITPADYARNAGFSTFEVST